MWRKAYRGSSSDGRTNRWTITCPNGHRFDPPSRYLRRERLTCAKCGAVTDVDYNGPDEWPATD